MLALSLHEILVQCITSHTKIILIVKMRQAVSFQCYDLELHKPYIYGWG